MNLNWFPGGAPRSHPKWPRAGLHKVRGSWGHMQVMSKSFGSITLVLRGVLGPSWPLFDIWLPHPGLVLIPAWSQVFKSGKSVTAAQNPRKLTWINSINLTDYLVKISTSYTKGPSQFLSKTKILTGAVTQLLQSHTRNIISLPWLNGKIDYNNDVKKYLVLDYLQSF